MLLLDILYTKGIVCYYRVYHIDKAYYVTIGFIVCIMHVLLLWGL